MDLVTPFNNRFTPFSCTGTLIKGPNGRNFILAARHCYALETTKAIQPLSTHVALFNYRLPCNATRAGNITKAVTDFLQARPWRRGALGVGLETRARLTHERAQGFA